MQRLACTGLLLAFGLLSVAACLRLEEPNTFHCDDHSQCRDGEKCHVYVCKPADYCRFSQDCGAKERCDAGKCVAGECSFEDDAVCGAFACNQDRRCYTSCDRVVGGCRSGTVCNDAGLCVPTLATGSDCEHDWQCASSTCCGPVEKRTCIETGCGRAGAACEGDGFCRSGNCCGDTFTESNLCSDEPCLPGEPGVPCTSNERCESGVCENNLCEGQPGKYGGSCQANDCQEGSCCSNGLTPRLLCRAVCSTVVGDPCVNNSACLGGFCMLEGQAGVCSRECMTAEHCGYGTRGQRSVCVNRIRGGSVGGVCLRECSTNADCAAGLTCVTKFGRQACDFSGDSWRQ